MTSAEARPWALRYADELPRVSKSVEHVVAECRPFESEMKDLAVRLMQNYLTLIDYANSPSR